MGGKNSLWFTEQIYKSFLAMANLYFSRKKA
jgi:hypothetical protein